MNTLEYDFVVVGGGIAALCSALSAAENGARVAVLEHAPEESRGGNSAFTANTMRAVYAGLDDIKKLAPDLGEVEIAETDFSSYSTDQFYDDMALVTPYRTNPDLCEVLVTNSNESVHWLRRQGVRFIPVIETDEGEILQDSPRMLERIEELPADHHEIQAFRGVLDEAEVRFPFDGMVEFTEPESGEKLVIDADGARQGYLDAVREFREEAGWRTGTSWWTAVALLGGRNADGAEFRVWVYAARP